MSRWLVAAGVSVAALAAVDLGRAGYSPDEEFTAYAVRGIHAHGLPLLPSGLLYDRGLLYSYAAAVVGGGDALWPARLLSLASSLAALAVLAVELRRWAAPGAAAVAVLAAGTSLPFWVSATTARFYAPFLLGYLGVLMLARRLSVSWRALVLLAAAAAATRWTHELAFTLVGPPLVAALSTRAGERRGWLSRAVAIAAGLAAGQAAILAVHALAPPSNGDVMVRRFFVWQVLNLFERPPLDLVAALPATAGLGAATALGLAAVRARVDVAGAALVAAGGVAAALGQIALAPTLVVAALPLAPAGARRLVPAAVAVTAAGAGLWIGALVVSGRPLAAAADLTVRVGTVYPLDMLAHLLRETPLTLAAVLAGLVARSAGLGRPWRPEQRALHGLWIGWVLWFGVIESGITARYLLLPVTFMLAALAVDLAAIVAATALPVRRVAAVLGALAIVVVTLEGWGGVPTRTSRAAAARPTLQLEDLRAGLQPDDLVVGHDELATVSVAGRIDAWLALDPFYRERFVVMRGVQPTGTYTGAPAAFDLATLLERATRGERRLMVVDVLKDLPGFGSTAQLVPRQLAREDLRADVVAEVPGARLLHVRPGSTESLAAR
ncbi:MAG: hypothetical protein AB7U83_00315 [Vicinamibacterales bacterium]